MVILEAQAAGVPVITSAAGGCEEGIVDGVTGFAVTERDVAQLAARLETLMLDDAVVDAMSGKAMSFVRERFDIAHCTHLLENVYDRVANSALGLSVAAQRLEAARG